MNVAVIASPSDARARADRIRQGMEALAPDILAAWTARDWEALGYDSWSDYVVGEFGGQLRLGRAERREAVRDLRSAGMSTRAIGSALGVGQTTVVRDVAGEPNGSPAPTPVTGLDGKTYAPNSIPTQPFVPALWRDATAVLDSIDALLLTDASAIAAAVPDRRKASTARRLRKLGTGLGRIAWILEGMEATSDDPV